MRVSVLFIFALFVVGSAGCSSSGDGADDDSDTVTDTDTGSGTDGDSDTAVDTETAGDTESVVELDTGTGTATEPLDTETVDTETVDTETVDTETVDTETVDTETVDTETVIPTCESSDVYMWDGSQWACGLPELDQGTYHGAYQLTSTLVNWCPHGDDQHLPPPIRAILASIYGLPDTLAERLPQEVSSWLGLGANGLPAGATSVIQDAVFMVLTENQAAWLHFDTEVANLRRLLRHIRVHSVVTIDSPTGTPAQGMDATELWERFQLFWGSGCDDMAPELACDPIEIVDFHPGDDVGADYTVDMEYSPDRLPTMHLPGAGGAAAVFELQPGRLFTLAFNGEFLPRLTGCMPGGCDPRDLLEYLIPCSQVAFHVDAADGAPDGTCVLPGGHFVPAQQVQDLCEQIQDEVKDEILNQLSNALTVPNVEFELRSSAQVVDADTDGTIDELWPGNRDGTSVPRWDTDSEQDFVWGGLSGVRL